MANLSPQIRSWFNQLEVSFNRKAGRTGLPKWLQNNTRHPVHSRTHPWTFEDHEYQLGILTCDHPHVAVKKAAQIGVTELSFRMTLALMSLYPGTNWIYVLPAIGFARKVSSTRILPVIQASPYLSAMLAKDPDSAEVRRIGDSFLFMAGAQNMRQAISIPAKGVIRDEYDFGVQSVLTSFKSRLEHNKEGEEILVDFSTPTIGDYGISKLFEDGQQQLYLCYHERCGHWTVVDPLHDLVVPGFDDELIHLTKDNLSSPLVRVKDTWVRCQQCQNPVSIENLRDPTRRSWVARFPDRNEIASFYVSPLDVPAIKTPARIIKGMEDYDRTQDWINYGLGKEFTNAENSVILAAVDQNAQAEVVQPRLRAMTGAYGGLDVGKTSNLMVLKPCGRNLDIVWMERITQKVDASGEDHLSKTTLQRIREYGMFRQVTDSAPDITVPQKVINRSGYHQAWACEFLRDVKRGKLDIIYPDEVTQVVQVVRTQMIDMLVGEINSGIIRACAKHPEYEVLKKHMGAMKRVSRLNDQGEKTVAWVSTSDENHYFFALLYARIAYELYSIDSSVAPLPCAVAFSTARVGGLNKGTKDRGFG